MNKLRTLIRALINESVAGDSVVYGTRDELEAMISAMEPDQVVNKDYIDSETGEVYLEPGERAGSSELHPQHAIDMSAARQRQHDQWEREQEEMDREDELQRSQAQDSYDAAVSSFVNNFKSDYESGNAGVDDPNELHLSSIAHDVAEQFFHMHREWKMWASVLGLSKSSIRSHIMDLLAS